MGRGRDIERGGSYHHEPLPPVRRLPRPVRPPRRGTPRNGWRKAVWPTTPRPCGASSRPTTTMTPATARRRRRSGRGRAASLAKTGPGTWPRPRSWTRTAGPRTPSGSGAAGAQEGEEGPEGARSGVTPCPRPPRGGWERVGAGRQHTAGASVPAQRFYRNRPVAEFQTPAATGGNGAVTCTAAGLPAGLVFDADGAGSCPGAEPREVCGTPTTLTSGTQAVAIAITAQDTNADANRASGRRPEPLTFQVWALARPALAGLSVGGVSGRGRTARFTSARGGVVESPLFRPPGR